MSILITGGTGFIGAEVLRQLVSQGASGNIHIVHRSGNYQRINDLLDHVHLIQADLADHETIAAIIEKTRPEVIYHLGAMLSIPSEGNPQASIETNAIGTYHLLEAARQNEVRQVLFASSIGVFGADIQEDFISDVTVQHPATVYGVTKVFGEQLGAYYKRKYGLDFRCIRYPSVIGPGVTTIGAVQFTSWIIEEPAKGKPYTVPVTPETTVPMVYYRDGARAIIDLGNAPLESIKTVTYLVDGVKPTPSMGELAVAVRAKIPDAQIEFVPDESLQALLDQLLHPLDDSRARSEWGWQPVYDGSAMIDDFLRALPHP
jgi:nucleoside-diphosphate-sugar epimerase